MLVRRLQILLDEARYRRLVARAKQRNLSVAAVVRDAIDRVVPADESQKRAAADLLLALDPIPVPEVDELKRELAEAHVA